MMQATRRRIGKPAWLGLILVVGLPALAEAQLFPNRTVTRQREACAAEPPFYSTVRRNYFGYYPTCWRKFPDGWACPCPNPELPNRTAAFAERPRDKFRPIDAADPDTGEMPGDDAGPGPAAPGAGDDSRMPPVPDSGRSPFGAELTPPDNVPRRNVPTPDPSLPPQTSRTPAPSARPAATPADTSSPTTGLLEMPRIAPPSAASVTDPSLNPSTLALAADATLASTDAATRPDLGPLPSAPLPGGAAPIGAELSADPSLLSQNQPGVAPAQAPQRKGILSGLFNSSKRRR